MEKSKRYLPKVKNPLNVDDFRPISVLSILSEPLEKHVHKHLISYLDIHHILHPLQSGFRPKHSCHTALTRLIDSWLFAIYDSKLIGAVFLDLRKAFDLVNHDILINKLKVYLNENETIRFFKSFLENRQQYVSVNESASFQGHVEVGVPQGSVVLLIYQ